MSAIEETTAVISRAAAALLAGARDEAGRPGADLRRACGDLVDKAAEHLRTRVIGDRLATAFQAATAAGCSLDGYEHVLSVIASELPISPAAAACCSAASRFALIETARVLGAMTFRSREEVQAVTARVNAAFSPAEDAAADLAQHVVYRDLVALHAAVTRDLAQRGRPLPRIVSFATANRLPALVLANRLYGAADRSSELVAENAAVHPLFMPAAGRALSA